VFHWDSAWGKGRWRIRAPHELVFKWAGSFDAERCFRLGSRLGQGGNGRLEGHDFRWQHDLHESAYFKVLGSCTREQLRNRGWTTCGKGCSTHECSGYAQTGSCVNAQSRQLSLCIWNQFNTICSLCGEDFRFFFSAVDLNTRSASKK
jgi:hypothetical protein